MYINTLTNTYPYSITQLKRDNPQTSFPKNPSNESLASFGVYPVQPTSRPEVDSSTARVIELPPTESGGTWLQAWGVQALSAEEIAANQVAATQALQNGIVQQTQMRLDTFARTRNYDGILSLCTYATSTIPRFQSEGQYGVNARDATWNTLYQILEEVQLGTRVAPTSFEDIEPDLPELVWPTS